MPKGWLYLMLQDGDGVYRSPAGKAVHWTRSDDGIAHGTNFTLAAHPNLPQVACAGVRYGVFITRDNGQPWAPFNGGLPPG